MSKVVKTKLAYKRVPGKRGQSRVRKVGKTKTIVKTKGKVTENELIQNLPPSQRATVLKSRFRNRTAQLLGTGAETGSSFITGRAIEKQNPVTSVTIRSLDQNVNGGIVKTDTARKDDDDDYDYGGAN